jgi:hypothetical protein
MVTSAALLALAGTARGQDAVAPPASPASNPEATTLAPVRVKAKADQETASSPVPGYTAKRSATATQTGTPLIERMAAIGATTTTPSNVGAVPSTCATSPTRPTSAIAARPTATKARPARSAAA